jgi:hypothetical protein
MVEVVGMAIGELMLGREHLEAKIARADQFEGTFAGRTSDHLRLVRLLSECLRPHFR